MENSQEEHKWIRLAREYLNEDYTQHLYNRALESDDAEYIKRLLKKAKSIWASLISEADQMINKKPN